MKILADTGSLGYRPLRPLKRPEEGIHRMKMRKHHARPDRGAGWSVTESDGGFTVWHEGEAWAVFLDRARALLTAAVLPHLEAGLAYRLRRAPSSAPGFDVTTKGSEAVGWVREYNPEMVEALHVVERIVQSPESLTLLLEAVGPGVLEAARRTAADGQDPQP